MRYFDASALAKAYIDEPDSDMVVRLMEAPGATSRLSSIEVPSAIIRRARESRLATEERDRALDALDRDLADILIVEVTPEVAAMANRLLTRHALRAADAIHLASCLWLRHELAADISVVAFDTRMAAAAVAEGLTVQP